MVGSVGGAIQDHTRESWEERASFLQSKCAMEDNGLAPSSAFPPHHSSHTT